MGHDMRTAFPSKYLKSADLMGKRIPVTIDRVDFEEVAQNENDKPVLYFQGKERGMVLNKTNTDRLCSAFGYDTDGWNGKEIHLYTEKVQYAGNMVDGLRVAVPLPEADDDDELPF